jgi:hypothetical protein
MFLTRQITGYIDADPSKKQQKALPISVFDNLLKDKFTPLSEALGQLSGGVFFFGMRSCEYLTVSGTRKTKRLKVRDIRFFKNNVEIEEKEGPMTPFADTVSITFRFQKNKKKDITITNRDREKNYAPFSSGERSFIKF